MKHRSYIASFQAIKTENSDYHIQNAIHICGWRMLECTNCTRVFCPDCDEFNGKIEPCCRMAIDAYVRDSSKKHQSRRALKQEMAKRIRRGTRKFKVKLEYIGDTL